MRSVEGEKSDGWGRRGGEAETTARALQANVTLRESRRQGAAWPTDLRMRCDARKSFALPASDACLKMVLRRVVMLAAAAFRPAASSRDLGGAEAAVRLPLQWILMATPLSTEPRWT